MARAVVGGTKAEEAAGRGRCRGGGAKSAGRGGECGVPYAGSVRAAGGSNAELLGSRAGRRRIRPRLPFRGSALHQVRLTERGPGPSLMFGPAERRLLRRGVSACVCVCVYVAGVQTAGIPFYSPRWGQELFRPPQLQRPGITDALPGLAQPWHLPPPRAARRVPRALSQHRRARRGAAGAGPAFSSARGGAAHWPKGRGWRGRSQWEPWLHLTHG